MEPIDVFHLCEKAANDAVGIPKFAQIERIFSTADYQAAWRNDPNRARGFIDGILCGNSPNEGLDLMVRMGIMEAILPEVLAMQSMGDNNGMHKNVWQHSLAVVNNVPNKLELRWGALLHDVGKVKTRRIDRGRVTFHGHDIVGARLVDSMQARIKLFSDDASLLRTVRKLVELHLRPTGYTPAFSDSAARRLLSDCGTDAMFDDLMKLSRADLTTKNAKKREKAQRNADDLERKVAEIRALDRAPKLPKGTMGLIIDASGRSPGPWLSNVKSTLEGMLRSGAISIDQPIEQLVKLGLSIASSAVHSERSA